MRGSQRPRGDVVTDEFCRVSRFPSGPTVHRASQFRHASCVDLAVWEWKGEESFFQTPIFIKIPGNLDDEKTQKNEKVVRSLKVTFLGWINQGSLRVSLLQPHQDNRPMKSSVCTAVYVCKKVASAVEYAGFRFIIRL